MKANHSRKFHDKPLQKIIKFYSPKEKASYFQFCEFIGGRSVQGMCRRLFEYAVARPQLMNEVIMEYDANAVQHNTLIQGGLK